MGLVCWLFFFFFFFSFRKTRSWSKASLFSWSFFPPLSCFSGLAGTAKVTLDLFGEFLLLQTGRAAVWETWFLQSCKFDGGDRWFCFGSTNFLWDSRRGTWLSVFMSCNCTKLSGGCFRYPVRFRRQMQGACPAVQPPSSFKFCHTGGGINQNRNVWF